MQHWGDVTGHDLWVLQMWNIALRDPREARDYVKDYMRLRSDPEEVLAEAMKRARGTPPELTDYVRDPTAIVAVVSSDYIIETVLGRLLSVHARAEGTGRDLGWLARQVEDLLPVHVHEGALALKPPFQPFKLTPGGDWISFGVPLLDGGSIIVLNRVRPAR